jgi:hypothetical protein
MAREQQRKEPANRKARSKLVWAGVGLALLALAFTFGLTFGGLGGSSGDEPAPQSTRVSMDAVPAAAGDANEQPERVRDLPARWAQAALRTDPVPIVVDPPRIEFDSAGPSEFLDIQATLTNQGDETLRIATSRADCGCTTVDLAGLFIEPGETIEITGTFKTRAEPGERTAIISVVFEGYSEPLRIPVRAIVQ